MSTPETKATFSSQEARVSDLFCSTSWFMRVNLSWFSSSLSATLQKPGDKVTRAWVHLSAWPWVSHYALSCALLCKSGVGAAEVEEVKQWALCRRTLAVIPLCPLIPLCLPAVPTTGLHDCNCHIPQPQPQEARANSWSAFNDPKPLYWLRRQLNLSQG